MKTPLPTGLAALDSYAKVLTLLTKSGTGREAPSPSKMELPFLQSVEGVENLYLTLSAVAPATPGAADEEWNPLSQRPHTPLPPPVSDELGSEIIALKEAVDAFTTLAHEMMHVALWEPFFVGRWKPRTRASFRTFSLMAEGYCFFYGDIVVSGAVRVRLPDGEFALDRQSPSNARFHPIRAFRALNIDDHEAILDIYLEGFNGGPTALWKPRGTSDFVAALAKQVYDFYQGSQRYLNELQAALAAFGGFTEFYRRFCAIPGLPTFLGDDDAATPDDASLKTYFTNFHRRCPATLAGLSPARLLSIRWRRMLQMRAYYALQVRWLLSHGYVVARDLQTNLRSKAETALDTYLDDLHQLLKQLAADPDSSPIDDLKKLDAGYQTNVRSRFQSQNAWVGHRWLIAPRRAGGHISLFDKIPSNAREAKARLLQATAYLVDELTILLQETKSVTSRAELLAQIQRVAALGAAAGSDGASKTNTALRQLRKELASPHLLKLWSVPLASFDPVANQYRELLFSYQ